MGISIASAMSGGQERELEEGAAGTNKQKNQILILLFSYDIFLYNYTSKHHPSESC
jgi:hypothetical protein